MIVFETERLVVRHFIPADKENYFRLSGSFEVMQYIRSIKTKKESDQYLDQIIADYKMPKIGRWAVVDKKGNDFIGSFAIIPVPLMPDKIQLGYSLTTDNWGKGYATELTKAGLQHFLDVFDDPEIFGVTEVPNVASQKVLLKCGFKPAGSMMENEKELLLFKVERS